MNNNYINVLISDGKAIQLIADTDIVITPTEGREDIHLSDVLYFSVLQKTIQEKKATLKPGKYTIRLMATIVGEEDEVPHTED
jgi:propanediol utilization protein